MANVYIYIVSFKDRNDVYVGQTRQNIKDRLSNHLKKDTTIGKFKIKNKILKKDIYIDIIDSLKNIDYDNYDDRQKVSYTERFHMLNMMNDERYNVININKPKWFHFKAYDELYNPNIRR